MAFQTPPEVLLRTVIRAVSKGMQQSPVSRPCHNTQRFYRAAVCTKIGQPLEVKEMPFPDKVPEGKVLIATHATGINFADILTAQGKYQERPKTPFIPGAELSGKVEGVGEGVEGWKKGDRVVALPVERAGFAEYCLVDPLMMFPAPDALSLVEAGAILISYATAMMALSRTAQLKEGETILVTAAAGATGLAAVDIAVNIFKAQVIGVCGGEEKCALLRRRGVAHTIDYRTEKIRDRVKEITSGQGVNVVMDQVGGDLFNDCLKSIAFEGRLITVGYASGAIPKVSINQLLLKSCSIRGVFWGSYGMRHPQAFMQSIHDILNAFNEGKLHPHVGKEFPLEKVNEAFDYIMDRQSTGKIVLKMRDE
ncbi:quinone oxidoreductase-like protein 2 homolog [Littorina saxatilis]|uniref:Enoyl reductase (ER) domain-containing protein n=1 Tax=Littorina saxatilis TaxID=31220 RepID=A0AAN9GBD4_9CAEN